MDTDEGRDEETSRNREDGVEIERGEDNDGDGVDELSAPSLCASSDDDDVGYGVEELLHGAYNTVSYLIADIP